MWRGGGEEKEKEKKTEQNTLAAQVVTETQGRAKKLTAAACNCYSFPSLLPSHMHTLAHPNIHAQRLCSTRTQVRQ